MLSADGKKIEKIYHGDRQAGSVSHKIVDYYNNRSFHTHPGNNRFVDINEAKRDINGAVERRHSAQEDWHYSNYAEKSDGGIGYADDRAKAGRSLRYAKLKANAANEILTRRQSKPLIADMSGKRGSQLNSMSKEERKHFFNKANKLVKKHNHFIDNIIDKVPPGESYLEMKRRTNPLIQRAMLTETIKRDFMDPEIYHASGDYLAEIRKLKDLSQKSKDPALMSKATILTPKRDVEAFHKTKLSNGTRSVFFDRRPRSIRKEEADALRNKVQSYQSSH